MSRVVPRDSVAPPVAPCARGSKRRRRRTGRRGGMKAARLVFIMSHL